MDELEEKVKEQAELCEKSKEYKVADVMGSQLAYLYNVSREEETTTKEKIELSLAMARIYETICRF